MCFLRPEAAGRNLDLCPASMWYHDMIASDIFESVLIHVVGLSPPKRCILSLFMNLVVSVLRGFPTVADSKLQYPTPPPKGSPDL